MSIGAITGQGVFSELEYKERRFKLDQWTNNAMDAVCTAAFLKAAQMVRMMGGNEKALAQREVALARTFALGGFGFDSIVDDQGLDNDDELLATFLHKLMQPHDANVTFALSLEMVKNNRSAVVKAVSSANPQNGSAKDQTGATAQDNPAPSQAPGNPSVTRGETSPT